MSKQNSRLDEALNLATVTAKGELADGDENKSVSAKATLAVDVTESGTTKKNAVNAGVTLGVSTSEEDAAPAANCGCCPHECKTPCTEKPAEGDSE